MKSNRVLVVEDNPQDLELLCDVLKDLVHLEITSVINARTAQASLSGSEGNFRMVLLNLDLGPGMDGIDLTRWIKDRWPELPVCVISGHYDDHQRRRAFEAGADHFWSKPYDATDNEAILALLRTHDAAIEKGRSVKSWRTTLWGCIAIAAGAVVAADFGALITKIAGCVAMAANGIGLLVARDNRTSDEQAGAGQITKP